MKVRCSPFLLTRIKKKKCLHTRRLPHHHRCQSVAVIEKSWVSRSCNTFANFSLPEKWDNLRTSADEVDRKNYSVRTSLIKKKDLDDNERCLQSSQWWLEHSRDERQLSLARYTYIMRLQGDSVNLTRYQRRQPVTTDSRLTRRLLDHAGRWLYVAHVDGSARMFSFRPKYC